MIAEPFTTCADFEVITAGDQVLAVIIFNPIPRAQIDYLAKHYARPNGFTNKILTARQWQVWGVLTTESWAFAHLRRPRPHGDRMQFTEQASAPSIPSLP